MFDTINTLWENKDIITALYKHDYQATINCAITFFFLSGIINFFTKHLFWLLPPLFWAYAAFMNWERGDYGDSVHYYAVSISALLGVSLGGFLGLYFFPKKNEDNKYEDNKYEDDEYEDNEYEDNK